MAFLPRHKFPFLRPLAAWTVLSLLLFSGSAALAQVQQQRRVLYIDLLESIGIQTTVQDFNLNDASTFLAPGFTLGAASLKLEPLEGFILSGGAELHSMKVAGPLSRERVWSVGIPVKLRYRSPKGYGLMLGAEKELYFDAKNKEGSIGAPLPGYDFNLTVHSRFMGLTGKYYPGNGMYAVGVNFIF